MSRDLSSPIGDWSDVNSIVNEPNIPACLQKEWPLPPTMRVCLVSSRIRERVGSKLSCMFTSFQLVQPELSSLPLKVKVRLYPFL